MKREFPGSSIWTVAQSRLLLLALALHRLAVARGDDRRLASGGEGIRLSLARLVVSGRVPTHILGRRFRHRSVDMLRASTLFRDPSGARFL
jgi:hypothetical protein